MPGQFKNVKKMGWKKNWGKNVENHQKNVKKHQFSTFKKKRFFSTHFFCIFEEHFSKSSRLRNISNCNISRALSVSCTLSHWIWCSFFTIHWLTVLVKFSPPPEFHRTFLDRSPLAAPSPDRVSWTGQIQGGGLNLTSTVSLNPLTVNLVFSITIEFSHVLTSNIPATHRSTTFNTKERRVCCWLNYTSSSLGPGFIDTED